MYTWIVIIRAVLFLIKSTHRYNFYYIYKLWKILCSYIIVQSKVRQFKLNLSSCLWKYFMNGNKPNTWVIALRACAFVILKQTCYPPHPSAPLDFKDILDSIHLNLIIS